jgi:hypothetical protein
MFRFLFALALTFCLFGANAAERYGEWLLEQPRSSVLTLSFKQSAPLDDKIPNDLGPGRKISSYVAINVSGFSDGLRQ